MNRSSISKGLVIGMFFGVLVPLGHGLVAGLVSIGLRANKPGVVFATFISNPITTPALLLATYHVGSAALLCVGVLLIEKFDWMFYVFGLFLLGTGVKMLPFAGLRPYLADNSLMHWIRNQG